MDSPRPLKPAAPSYPAPVVVIGAGGIVRTAHLPAYQLAGFPVASVYDLDSVRATALASDFGIKRTCASLGEAISTAPKDAVYDIAVPAFALREILDALPDASAVLIQKPFGENLDQARELLALCRRKRLKAAVNFQLRFAPCVATARSLISSGAIGEIHDMEVRVTVYTPWHLWTFLEQSPRVEILYHSIHHLDVIRSFLGNPKGVYAKTVKHPGMLRLASTRTAVALDYGDMLRANVTANHGHLYGPKHQESYIKWEGTRGALKAKMGLLLNYPNGEPDVLELCRLDSKGNPSPWESVGFEGNWFPHAFIGTMRSLQNYVAGTSTDLPTGVEDAFHTMALVEAAYESSQRGGTPILSA